MFSIKHFNDTDRQLKHLTVSKRSTIHLPQDAGQYQHVLWYIARVEHQARVAAQTGEECAEPSPLVINRRAKPQPLDGGNGPAELFGTHRFCPRILIATCPNPFSQNDLGSWDRTWVSALRTGEK